MLKSSFKGYQIGQQCDLSKSSNLKTGYGSYPLDAVSITTSSNSAFQKSPIASSKSLRSTTNNNNRINQRILSSSINRGVPGTQKNNTNNDISSYKNSNNNENNGINTRNKKTSPGNRIRSESSISGSIRSGAVSYTSSRKLTKRSRSRNSQIIPTDRQIISSQSSLHSSPSSNDTVTCSGSCSDDDSSTTSSGEPNLPYPGFPDIALKYLTQDTKPRNWCLRLITNPYPFSN